jgi:hypothetical protein
MIPYLQSILDRRALLAEGMTDHRLVCLRASASLTNDNCCWSDGIFLFLFLLPEE